MLFLKPQRADVSELLFRYLKHYRSESVSVSDPLLLVTLFFLSFNLMYGLT